MKRILAAVVFFAVLMQGLMIVRAEKNPIKALEYENTFVVNGQLNDYKPGERIMLMIRDNEDNILYIDQSTVDRNGNYEFFGKTSTDVKAGTVYVNNNGVNISSSIKTAELLSEKYTAELDLMSNNGTKLKSIANVTTHFPIDDNYYLLVAQYTEDGKLTDCKVTKGMVNGSATEEKDIEVKDNTAYAKAFLFKSMTKMEPLKTAATEKIYRTISCWGDSVTAGHSHTNSYPQVLEELSGVKVYNFGGCGEGANTIAARQGGLDTVVSSDFTIPASNEEKAQLGLNILSPLGEVIYGGLINPQNNCTGDFEGGVNPCHINGVKGTLSCVSDGTHEYFYFQREESGEAVEVAAGSKLVTNAAITRNEDIMVVLAGYNGGGTDFDTLADYIQAMTDNLADENKKYIILGMVHSCSRLRALDESDVAKYEQLMKERFGEHYLPLQEAFTSPEIFGYCGLTATESELKEIANGTIPKRLCPDEVHFSHEGYIGMAHVVYNKMIELGYLPNNQ